MSADFPADFRADLPVAQLAAGRAGFAVGLAGALAALAGAGGVAAVQAFNYLLPSAGIRALAITRTLARYFERLLGHRDALHSLADLRPRLFARLAAADMGQMMQRGSGTIAANLGSDVEALEDLAIRRVSVISALAGALAGVVAAMLAGPLAAVLLGSGLVISVLLEAEAVQVDQARSAIVRAEGRLQLVQLTIASCTVAAMLATATASAPAALQALAALAGAAAFEALGGISHSLLQRARVDAALARLSQIAQMPVRAADQERLPEDTAITLGEGENAITLTPGERVRISGPSGSGKTRLVQALCGLQRDLFALSAQDAPLLAGTIADNLRLARPGVTEAEMWAALDVACLADTVRAMPAALETWLGPDGARLSGGQRKRLSLARAMLAGKPWLVLDEPSEGLDLKTENAVALGLDAWLRETGTGLVLVNHRSGLDWLAQRVYAVNETQVR